MKCRLCDRPTTAGSGKLCLECTKALHRARARTGTPRRALGAPPTTGEASVTTYAAPNPAPKVILAAPWQRWAAWSAAGLLAIGIVFLAQPGRQSVPEAHGVDHAPTPLAPRAAGETPAAPSVGLTTTAALKASDAPAASPTPGTKCSGGWRESITLRRRRKDECPDTDHAGQRQPELKDSGARQSDRRRHDGKPIESAAGIRNHAIGAGERPDIGLRDRRRAGIGDRQWQNAAARPFSRASSANRRRTCGIAKTNGTRIPIACARRAAADSPPGLTGRGRHPIGESAPNGIRAATLSARCRRAGTAGAAATRGRPAGTSRPRRTTASSLRSRGR